MSRKWIPTIKHILYWKRERLAVRYHSPAKMLQLGMHNRIVTDFIHQGLQPEETTTLEIQTKAGRYKTWLTINGITPEAHKALIDHFSNIGIIENVKTFERMMR